MEVIIKEGKNLEELLNSVCEEYNVSNNDFYYHYSETKSGLFGKNTIVNLSVIMKKDLLEYIKEYLQELLTNMGLTVNFETKIREDSMFIKIYSSNNPVLIGKGGNTLKALENIVKQKINTEFDIRALVSLDVEKKKKKQQNRLERLAKNLAKEVVKTNVEVHLENMNAFDRRIVHNALTNFKGVKTESIGEEPNRHVVIKPEEKRTILKFFFYLLLFNVSINVFFIILTLLNSFSLLQIITAFIKAFFTSLIFNKC